MSELPLRYLAGYPENLQKQIREVIEQDQLAAMLHARYPGRHEVHSDAALYEYTLALKNRFLRKAPVPDRVLFDSRLQLAANALGVNGKLPRIQGSKIRCKREIRVASVFKQGPPEFLRMVVVHELAHLKERKHDRAFYQLCSHMEPAYHQLEFDLRLYLTQMELTGQPGAWPGRLAGRAEA